MSLSKTIYPLLSTDQPRKTGNCSDITEIIVDSINTKMQKKDKCAETIIKQYSMSLVTRKLCCNKHYRC